MRYLSPASLPDSPPLNPPDKKALMLQRRKLLAELELSADGLLHIKDRPLSKNEILEYFETLQDETILNYHAAVSKDKILVDFLEEGELPEEALFAEAGLYSDIHFLEWISPYFFTAFIEYVTKCFQQAGEEELHVLLQNHLLLTDYDQERAWIQIGHLLENNISRLRHFHEQAGQGTPLPPIEDIIPLATDPEIRMILQFPEGPFSGVRDKYAIALMEASIDLFNKYKENRDTALAWMENAKRLAVSTDLAAAVDENIHGMKKMHKKSDAGMIRAAIFIGVLLLRLLTCRDLSNHSSGTIPQFTKFNYITGKDTIAIHNIRQLDSVMHKMKLPDSAHNLLPR